MVEGSASSSSWPESESAPNSRSPSCGTFTLATTLPEFLQPTQFAAGPPPGTAPDPSRGLAAYAAAAQEWRAAQAWEKGLA